MSEPFIAEIRIFGGGYAPRGWAFCNGQIMAIAQHTTLFSIIGTTYGGDGRTNMALPNLQGRVPMHQGDAHFPGQVLGAEVVALTEAQIGGHIHVLDAAEATGTTTDPTGQFPAIFEGISPGRGQPAVVPKNYQSAPSSWVQVASSVLAPSGKSKPHNNLQPYLALNFCIALTGIYPPRS